MDQFKLIIGFIILGVLIYFVWKSTQKKSESFAAGHSLVAPSVMYDAPPVENPTVNYSAAHFADLVHSGNTASEYVKQPSNPGEVESPMERLTKLHDSMKPRISSGVTPFNVDLANPKTYHYMTGGHPTIHTKSRQKDYSLYNILVGDIPIKYHPGFPFIEKSQWGIEDSRPEGLFTHYNRTNANHNYPIKVAGAGQPYGYGGASGEVIMDSY